MTTTVQSFVARLLCKYCVAFFTLFVGLATITAAQAQTCPTGTVVYVDSSNISGAHDGTTWATAFNTLQDALYAVNKCTISKQIWVAKGTYYPDEGIGKKDNDSTATFQLKNNLVIYGGFSGTEINLTDRNLAANTTVLSGDINKNKTSDGADANNVTNGSNTDKTAILDGFIITGGFSNNTNMNVDINGGGMLNNAGSPTINNCIFTITGAQALY